MSKSTNTVVYFDWKTLIYIYVWGRCHTQFMLPMEKSDTFPGACANEIIPNGQLARLLTKRKKDVMLEVILELWIPIIKQVYINKDMHIQHNIPIQIWGRRGMWPYWIYNQCLSPLMFWGRFPLRASCMSLCDEVCQWLAAGRWFFPGTLYSYTTKTDRHDKTEILVKVALCTIIVYVIYCQSYGAISAHLVNTNAFRLSSIYVYPSSVVYLITFFNTLLQNCSTKRNQTWQR
jgi:hypothetical protein